MSAAKTVVFETGHEEIIHDAQLDYYGKRLATASSDRSIRIFEVSGPNNERQLLLSTLRGHEGPVWQIAWAHPKFGSILASSSYDGRVAVWKESAANVWGKIYEQAKNDSSANCISWAPHSMGLVLAVGRSDGSITVLARKDNNEWESYSCDGHRGSVNGISWAPNALSGAAGGNKSIRFDGRFVSGGSDNRVYIWSFDPSQNKWIQSGKFIDGPIAGHAAGHNDWVRDVAWAPSMGLPHNTIASASEDKSVIIWSEDSTGVWRIAKQLLFNSRVWRVSWSVMGNILAVAQGDNKVSLWKESLDGDWKNVSTVNDSAATTQINDNKIDGKIDS